MKELKLALLGFGVAGKGFSQILLDRHDAIWEDKGLDVKVTAITTGRSGCLVDPEGIDLARALELMEARGSFQPGDPGYRETDSLTVVREGDYDALIEMTPTNIKNGQPAIDYLTWALERDKHVITANKGPVAFAYGRLKKLAREKGRCFFYETSVMVGTPLFNMAETCLPYCKVKGVRGLLNASCNYFLEELGRGRSFDHIMEEARRAGFLEADPSQDLDGWDAAVKLTALMNVFMNAEMDPARVERTGIRGVTADQAREALARGKKIRLLCQGHMDCEGRPVAVVRPEEIPFDDPLAASDLVACLRLDTDLMGPISIGHHKMEPGQTGYGLFSDLVRLVRHVAETL